MRAGGEPHGGIIVLPQDDLQRDRFFLRCEIVVTWITAAFDTPRNHLFRWTDLQQERQRGYTLAGFSAAEIAYALGRGNGTCLALPDFIYRRMRYAAMSYARRKSTFSATRCEARLVTAAT